MINLQPQPAQNLTSGPFHNHALIHHHLAESHCTWDLIINHTGQVIYCSSSCKRITGFPPEVFLHNISYFEKIIHQEDKKFFPILISNGQKCNTQTKEYRIIVSTGEVKWIASFLKPITLGERAEPGTLVSSFDITSYRESAMQLKQQNNILQKRNNDLVKQLSGAYRDIEFSKKQLLAQNKDLDKNNKELLETNNALRVLAKNLDSVKKNTEERLINDIYKNIYPLASKLKNSDTKTIRTRLIDNLLYKIDELCHTLNSENGTNLRKSLTTTEIKVAAMIKKDLHSSEIARKLRMSVATVKTHRRNIRRKFKIQNSKINLANYLKLKWQN